MQEGNDVSEEMIFRARERKERNMNLDCKCSFINFYTGVPFQCLANEFKLLFMRAFFSMRVFFYILIKKIVFELSLSKWKCSIYSL